MDVGLHSSLTFDHPIGNIFTRHRTSDSDLAVPGIRTLVEFQAGTAVEIDLSVAGARPISKCNLGALIRLVNGNRNVSAPSDQRHVIALDATSGIFGLVLEVQNTLFTERHRKRSVAFGFDELMNVQSAFHNLNIVLGAVECAKRGDFTSLDPLRCRNTMNRVGCSARKTADFEGGGLDNLVVTSSQRCFVHESLQIFIVPGQDTTVLFSISRVRVKQERLFGEVLVFLFASGTAQRSSLVLQEFKMLLRFDDGCLCRIDKSVNGAFLHVGTQRLA
ncbi:MULTISPECIES: hypothetical protein [Pandoraea]|uniref:hypothetical protein n=1 Tax=Pandoraea TaxID=93217 RepID=UPI001438A7AD|nr:MULTISPECIES: hypothetical protein [Pandoraea]